MVKGVADEVGLLGNLRSILTAARAASIKVFFVPHRRWEPGDYEDWDHPNPSQRWVEERQTFAKGSWGGEWHPDFGALGAERLRQYGPRFSTQAARRHACRHRRLARQHVH
jgi:nicotinamidase-related amidase